MKLVYIIKWYQVEPLLDLEDSKALGILQTNPVEATTSDNTHIPWITPHIISDNDVLFSGIGKFESTEVNFTISDQIKSVIQWEQSIPLAYRDRLSTHLGVLKKYVIRASLDPKTPMPWLFKVVVTEKKIPGKVCRNTDMRHVNIAFQQLYTSSSCPYLRT